jgi:hypothetical protein
VVAGTSVVQETVAPVVVMEVTLILEITGPLPPVPFPEVNRNAYAFCEASFTTAKTFSAGK